MSENDILAYLRSPAGWTERDQSQISLILLRGVEDLPDTVSGWIADSLNAIPFDSNWKKPESFDDKLKRLNKLVIKTKKLGKDIVFIGVSAGAGLGMAFVLAHQGKIRHLFSLSGIVDPNLPANINKGKMSELCQGSKSFKEMSELLTSKLHLEDGLLNVKLIKEMHLKRIVSTYSSNDDEIVPLTVSEPLWVVNRKRVGEGKHAISIAQTLILDLRKQLVFVKEAKLD